MIRLLIVKNLLKVNQIIPITQDYIENSIIFVPLIFNLIFQIKIKIQSKTHHITFLSHRSKTKWR